MQSVCRHQAVYAALVYGEHYQTKIDFGPTQRDPYIWHAQAKAFINGEWVYLTVSNGHIWRSKQDKFISINSYQVNDFVKLFDLKIP